MEDEQRAYELEHKRRLAYEVEQKRRLEFIADVQNRWRAYLSKGAADAHGNATAPPDRLLRLAIELMDHVRVLEERGPLQDVKFGEIPAQKDNALHSIRGFTNIDLIYETSSKGGAAPPVPIHPIELMLGELVRRARSLGASWREIGSSMGMTGQGAQKRAREKGWVDESDTLPDNEE